MVSQGLFLLVQLSALFFLCANTFRIMKGIHRVELVLRQPKSPLEVSIEHQLQRRFGWGRGIPELRCRHCRGLFLPEELFEASYPHNACSKAPKQPLMWYLLGGGHGRMAPFIFQMDSSYLMRTFEVVMMIQQAKLEEAFRAKT